MLENDRLKPYFLQIDLENMIMTAKNIKIISLVGINLEFRTGPDLCRHGPWTFHLYVRVLGSSSICIVFQTRPRAHPLSIRYVVVVRVRPFHAGVCVWMDRSTTMHALAAGAHDGYCRWCPDRWSVRTHQNVSRRSRSIVDLTISEGEEKEILKRMLLSVLRRCLV